MQNEGTIDTFLKNTNSPTARYLSGKDEIAVPKNAEKEMEKNCGLSKQTRITFKMSVSIFHLENLLVLPAFLVLEKSSLINQILAPHLLNELNRASQPVGKVERIEGIRLLDKAID